MKMSKNYIWILICLALISILIYFLLEQNSNISIEKTATDNINVPDKSVKKLSDKIEKSNTTFFSENSLVKGLSSNQIINKYESVPTAYDGLNLIELILEEGRESLGLTLIDELHSRCGSINGFEPPFEQTKWAHEKIMAYCDNYDPYLYHAHNSKIYSLNKSFPDFTSLMLNENLTDIDSVTEEFFDMLGQLVHRNQLSGAGDVINFYSDHLGIPLQLGQTDQVNPIEVSRIQNIALDVYMCQVNGGCGPDGFATLGLCTFSTECMQGWSTIDFYQNTLSPLHFEQVMNIVTEIQRNNRQKP